MKKAYKSGDKELGEYNHLMQYTMKILLNSLYGATALPNLANEQSMIAYDTLLANEETR